ncbi:MAG: hypothetical protein U0892_02810 [Pirellulales bacterium]
MTIYRYTNEAIESIQEATFAELSVAERNELQRLLRDQIEIILPDTLIIAEEFADWDGSQRRIDLLGIDRDANLVVFELKRTTDGGHMDLQAIRYASMVSSMTFAHAVRIFASYNKLRGRDIDAEKMILAFLGWTEPVEEDFAGDVRIVLASAEFGKEITTAVLWLRDKGVDIRCVRIKPYGTKELTVLDVQQVIPLPEAEDFGEGRNCCGFELPKSCSEPQYFGSCQTLLSELFQRCSALFRTSSTRLRTLCHMFVVRHFLTSFRALFAALDTALQHGLGQRTLTRT